MRRHRARDWETLFGFTVMWVAAVGIWVWGRFNPTPALPSFDLNSGNMVGVFIAGSLIGLRPLVDAAMPYIVLSTPILFGAWVFFVKREQREMRRDQVAASLRQLTPDRFEDWCATRLRELGYDVTVTGGHGDHGVDLFARKDGELTVVQCKRFGYSESVGEPQIRDLYGAMHDAGATGAIAITTGQYTRQAMDWIRGKPLQLWGPSDLGVTAVPSAPATLAPSPAVVAPEKCPRCGSILVLRTNRRTRESFIGCSSYPRCRFTRSSES